MICKFIAVVLFLFLISFWDIKNFVIPNILLFGIVVMAGIFYTFDFSFILVWRVSASLVLGLIFFAIKRLTNGLGLGDVKLISVLCFSSGFFCTVFACLAASIAGLIFIILKNKISGNKTKRIPFAPFLSLGTIVCYFPFEGFI